MAPSMRWPASRAKIRRSAASPTSDNSDAPELLVIEWERLRRDCRIR